LIPPILLRVVISEFYLPLYLCLHDQ